MPGEKLLYPKMEINRAGELVRRVMGGVPLTGIAAMNEFTEALFKVNHFRGCHAYPLQKATMGLRSTVSTAGAPAPLQISQRLKRLDTILDKLQREPSMDLARMQDIGGCRAILPDIDTLRLVQKRLERSKKYVKTADYVGKGKARESGYRGVHVILEYDDRRIEVQLRTPMMHAWSITVERLGGRLQEDLKSGAGAPDLLAFFQTVSKVMELEELQEPVPADLLAEVNRLRAVVDQYIAIREGTP